MRRLLVMPCLILLIMAVVLPACSGGGNGNDSKSTPQAAATAPASVPSAGPTSSGTTGDSTPAGPGNTPSAVVDMFASLQSYRYQLDVSGDGATAVTVKGSVVAPDQIAIDFYLGGSDTPIASMVIMGDKAWSNTSMSGGWESIDVAEAEAEFAGLMPQDFWGMLPPVDEIIRISSDLGQEPANGIPARHYQMSHADLNTLNKLTDILGTGDPSTSPDDVSIDLWSADDGGWPVKATIDATYPASSDVTQARINWDVTDVNSSAIVIQPPA